MLVLGGVIINSGMKFVSRNSIADILTHLWSMAYIPLILMVHVGKYTSHTVDGKNPAPVDR